MQTIQEIFQSTLTIRRTTEKVISKVEVSEEEAFKMLGTAYIAHIHERNMAYKYDKATFDALKSAAKWASDPKAKNSLLIVGGVGTGKTTLAKALCDVLNAEYKFRYDGCFAASFKTASAIELTAAARNDNEKFEMYKECMRLFIDDFGTEPDSVKIFGNTLSPMTELLYRRYDRNRPTIITTNLSQKDILEKYGLRLADRLKEICNKISIVKESYR